MFDKIFGTSTAKVLDVISSYPGKVYTDKEISLLSNLSMPTTKKALETLEMYQFVEKVDRKKYSLIDNDMTTAYLIADYYFKEKNKKLLKENWENMEF